MSAVGTVGFVHVHSSRLTGLYLAMAYLGNSGSQIGLALPFGMGMSQMETESSAFRNKSNSLPAWNK